MREKIKFDQNWMFHKGDIREDFPICKKAAYLSAKTEHALWGPASKDYNVGPFAKEDWRLVHLPHDYVIESLPDKKYNEALGFFPYENAWYVKTFPLDEADRDKRVTLYFEGVATHATVYVNGCLLTRNFCGYTSFEVDISDVMIPGGQNRVAVYVSTEEHEGWWYEGGGIYRHVWLVKTDPVAVNLYGLFARPIKEADGSFTLIAESEIRNDRAKRARADLLCEIISPLGETVATAETSGFITEKSIRTFRFTIPVKDPLLWSPDTPHRYRMRVTTSRGGRVVDVDETKFGFRHIEIDPEKGLFINGKHYKIKGLCGHADCGLTGKAVPDNIHRYKVRLMKDMGANGYRTSHYPQAEALMDALDENGFIVMNETRHFDSSPEGIAQLEMLVRRDRNRPGVVFWSLGNEEPLHAKEQGKKIMQTLAAVVRRLDPSRFITTAVSFTPERATVYDDFSVVGINYNWKAYNGVHEKYPNKAVLSAENCATGTTRGWYFDPSPEQAFLPAHDRDTNQEFKSREYTWKFIAEREWMLGGYQWIAFEHRGEATWPRLCSQSGAIDLFLQRKDAFYQNRSHWTSEPMVHLLPHWSFHGLEGEPIRVFAYTNTERLELFLNGESLGAIDVEPYGHGEWVVPYHAGRLEVKAYLGGKEVASDCRVTAGAPKRLVLTLDTTDVEANGEDIAIFSCYTVDENGIEVPTATPEVTFNTNALGRIYSTGSDITDHSTLFSPKRKMRAGRIGVAVKLGQTAGTLKVYAHSDGLESAVCAVEIAAKS